MLFHSNLLSVQSEGSLPEPFIMHTHTQVPVLALFPCLKRRRRNGLGFSHPHMCLIITDPVHQWQGAMDALIKVTRSII